MLTGDAAEHGMKLTKPGERPAHARKAALAELTFAVFLVGYGAFSVNRLVLLLLFASLSLWLRGFSWSDVGLRHPIDMWGAVLQAAVAALATLVAVRIIIVPFAVWTTGVRVDLSALGEPGDSRVLWTWLPGRWPHLVKRWFFGAT